MNSHTPSFPFFAPTERRPLSLEESSIVARLLSGAAPELLSQLEHLAVVGRCGCGECPTVFFQPHQVGDREQDICQAIGPDETGGLVGAVLMEKAGLISQLEFYSVDGHSPWQAPLAESLEVQS